MIDFVAGTRTAHPFPFAPGGRRGSRNHTPYEARPLFIRKRSALPTVGAFPTRTRRYLMPGITKKTVVSLKRTDQKLSTTTNATVHRSVCGRRRHPAPTPPSKTTPPHNKKRAVFLRTHLKRSGAGGVCGVWCRYCWGWLYRRGGRYVSVWFVLWCVDTGLGWVCLLRVLVGFVVWCNSMVCGGVGSGLG